MTRARRTVKVLAIGIAVLGGLVACSDDPDDDRGSPEAAEKTDIVLQVSGEAEELAVYEQVVEAVEEDVTDVDVELVGIASKGDHIESLISSFAAGDPPDLFLLNFREYSSFVAQGAVEPVGDHLELDLAEYYDAPLEAFNFNGKLQCFPQNVSSLVVYYNTELFEAAGIEHPESWTWDEFRAAGETLTTDGVRGIGVEPQVIRLAPFVWGNGGELTDDPDEPTEFVLSQDPASKEAVENFVGLARDGLTPTREELAAEAIESQFINGKLAMFLSSRRETPVFREAADLAWDVAPLPVSEEPASMLHSDAYCIAADSPNIDAAVRVLESIVGPTGQTVAAVGGRTVPSLIEVAEGPFLDPSQAPEHSQVFLDAIPVLRRTPVLTTWPEIEDLADEILEKMFYEPGYTIDEGLAEMDEVTRDLFAEAAEAAGGG